MSGESIAMAKQRKSRSGSSALLSCVICKTTYEAESECDPCPVCSAGYFDQCYGAEIAFDRDDEDDPLIALEDDPIGVTVHQPYSAFNQGFSAGEQGIPISLNPYPVESREEHWWNHGYEHGSGEAG